MKGKTTFIIIIVVLALIILKGSLFVVDEMHFAVVTQFGDPRREIAEPGLYFKTPLIQNVNRFPKQIIKWESDPVQFVTKDKRQIWTSTWARWRIVDPLQFYKRLRREQFGHGTLDDRIESGAKTVIASYDLIELVRNSNRELIYSTEDLVDTAEQRKILVGREKICREILARASLVGSEGKTSTLESEYGMKLVDVQIDDVIYVEEVQKSVYARMREERERIAKRYRSEGMEEANKIIGSMNEQLLTIESEGYREAQELRGQGDAEALSIYAVTYSKDPDFYQFWKTLKTYEQSIDERTTLIMSLDNDYFRLLGGPNLAPPKPAP